MYFYYKKQIKRHVLKVCFKHKNATFSQSDLMQTNWATGSLWVVWIICKHFPFYRLWFWFWFPGVAALCSGMKSRFVGSVWSVWGVVKTTTTPCDRCTDSATSFWQMLRDGMVWGGFVIKGGNLNAERYPLLVPLTYIHRRGPNSIL